MSWNSIDLQMRQYADRIQSEVKLSAEHSSNLATSIAADVRFLSVEQKLEIKAASPIALEDRMAELTAFQAWMDQAHLIKQSPAITRAQVLTQSYICFVYLPESCFRALAKVCPSGSAARKCAQFLSNNPVRACYVLP
jgi:hypothetical protein